MELKRVPRNKKLTSLFPNWNYDSDQESSHRGSDIWAAEWSEALSHVDKWRSSDPGQGGANTNLGLLMSRTQSLCDMLGVKRGIQFGSWTRGVNSQIRGDGQVQKYKQLGWLTSWCLWQWGLGHCKKTGQGWSGQTSIWIKTLLSRVNNIRLWSSHAENKAMAMIVSFYFFHKKTCQE